MEIFGVDVPRAMVWMVYLFVLVSTVVAFWLGHPLIRLYFLRERLSPPISATRWSGCATAPRRWRCTAAPTPNSADCSTGSRRSSSTSGRSCSDPQVQRLELRGQSGIGRLPLHHPGTTVLRRRDQTRRDDADRVGVRQRPRLAVVLPRGLRFLRRPEGVAVPARRPEQANHDSANSPGSPPSNRSAVSPCAR